jgi:hypothetical protein
MPSNSGAVPSRPGSNTDRHLRRTHTCAREPHKHTLRQRHTHRHTSTHSRTPASTHTHTRVCDAQIDALIDAAELPPSTAVPATLGVSPATSASGLGPTPATFAPGLGPYQICAGAWPTPATSAPGLGPPLPHLRLDFEQLMLMRLRLTAIGDGTGPLCGTGWHSQRACSALQAAERPSRRRSPDFISRYILLKRVYIDSSAGAEGLRRTGLSTPPREADRPRRLHWNGIVRRPCHIHAGTGLTPAKPAPGLGSLRPHLRRDSARSAHICAGTGLTPATSAPGPGRTAPRRSPC